MPSIPIPRLLVLLAAILTVRPGSAANPSFDCRRAGNEIEKLICSDAKLSALDRLMAELFGKAMHQTTGSAKAELLAEQRGWIKNRNGCARRSEPRHSCVLEHYTQRNARLEELSGRDAEAESSRYTVSFRCDDYGELRATFYTGTPSTVRIELGEAKWTLPHAASGSGSRYAGNGVVFWSKGQEALFEQGEKTQHCRKD